LEEGGFVTHSLRKLKEEEEKGDILAQTLRKVMEEEKEILALTLRKVR
jgi:hypothetical protein